MAMAAGRAGSSGSGRNEQRAGESFFIRCDGTFFFSAFLKCSHVVCHLGLCVCVGEGTWACRVPFSRRSISQSGRFSAHTYQAESKETVCRKVLNKVSK